MPDTRPRVLTNGKAVNLSQLSAELGGVGLCGDDTQVVAAEGVNITQAALEAAVAAHVADPTYGLSVEQRRLRELRDKPTLTTPELTELVKLMARRMS